MSFVRRQFTALFACLVLWAGPTMSANLCDDIEAIQKQSRQVSLTLPDSTTRAECSRSLILAGGEQVQCGWAFTFRAEAARDAFRHLVNSVSRCLGDEARRSEDQGVNHPDTYDLRIFTDGRRQVFVSLKDKAALQQTYVFLRIAKSSAP